MASKWDMGNWTKADNVSLMDAFGGVKKGTISFPKLTPRLTSAAVASGAASMSPSQNATQQSSGNVQAQGGSPANGTTEAANEALGKQLVAAAGWTGDQWTAFNNIVMAESKWNVAATNPSSGAYGIPQALPGSKMASAGANWQSSAATQIAWMIGYIKSRYGTPVNAWNFHLANGWY
jgi:hypothetical protein